MENPLASIYFASGARVSVIRPQKCPRPPLIIVLSGVPPGELNKPMSLRNVTIANVIYPERRSTTPFHRRLDLIDTIYSSLANPSFQARRPEVNRTCRHGKAALGIVRPHADRLS